jgi:hypothetical protein
MSALPPPPPPPPAESGSGGGHPGARPSSSAPFISGGSSTAADAEDVNVELVSSSAMPVSVAAGATSIDRDGLHGCGPGSPMANVPLMCIVFLNPACTAVDSEMGKARWTTKTMAVPPVPGSKAARDLANSSDVAGAYDLYRRSIVATLRAKGLEVSHRIGSDGTRLYALVGMPEETLRRHAEQSRFEGLLRETTKRSLLSQWFGHRVRRYRPYTIAEAPLFEDFLPAHRLRLLQDLVQYADDGCTGIALRLRMERKHGRIRNHFLLHETAEKDWLVSNWGRVLRRQPIARVYSYFGAKIAMYFSFLGFYTQWLTGPAIVGSLVFAYGLSVGTMDSELTPYYCVALAVWTTVFIEFWKRHQASNAV